MVRYRRAYVPGATYFFTVTLHHRRCDWLTTHVELLRAAMRHVRQDRPFSIDAMVVLPDHLHTLWTLPPGDADYSGRWRAIKACFSRGLAEKELPVFRNQRGECDVWQRRFWEHVIRNDEDRARHIDYTTSTR